MRLPVLLIALTSAASAQFRTGVPLVLAPTTIRDAKGHYIDGLAASDLILYDNNVAQKIQIDWGEYPISLAVAVQTGANSGPVIDKLGRTGILLSDTIAAAGGETAILTFSDTVRLCQDFTPDAALVTHALRMIRRDGEGARVLDAIAEASGMLERRPPQRRRVLVMIAEKRDRGSSAKQNDVIERAEQANITIYWLTFSPFLEPFTERPKTMEDLKPEEKRIKGVPCALCERPDDRAAPLDVGPGGIAYALGELFHMRNPDLSVLFGDSTGGRTLGFMKKSALEQTIQRVGQEVHRQYILSFTPNRSEPGFHAIRVVVRNRADLIVRTRPGYWVAAEGRQ